MGCYEDLATAYDIQSAKLTEAESALDAAKRMIEDLNRREQHLKHTINVLQDALTRQAVLMGIMLEAAGDETEQD